jgi:cell division protein FtsN
VVDNTQSILPSKFTQDAAMAHDFAKKRAPSSSRGRDTPPKSTHWLWFFSGLFVGILGSVIVFLAVGGGGSPSVTKTPKTVTETTPTPATKSSRPPQQPTRTTDQTQFTFYTLLPESEVIVGDEPETQSPTTTPTTEPGNLEKPAASDAPRLSLQAGSFQQLADADRRRGDVILLGFNARIETVENGTQRWHRVHVGPFQDAATLARAQRTLKDVGIDTIKVGRSGT